MSGNYLLPNFTPFRSSGGICRPSTDYRSMESHEQNYKYEKQLDNAFIKANGGTAYSTMNGGKKKRSASKGKKKSTTTKKKKTKSKSKSTKK